MMLRKFFFKRLKKYTFIMLLPLIVVMNMSLLFLVRSRINDIKTESESSSQRLETNIDQLFSDAIYQQNIITGNPKIILSLRKMLSDMTMDYNNYSLFNTMTGLIRSVNMADPYIISIYYYQDGCSRIYSSEEGIREIHDLSDNSWTTYLDKAGSLDIYVTTRKYSLDSFYDEKEVLSFFMGMPTMKGTAIINVDLDNLRARMDSLCTYPYESLYALSSDGKILFSSSDKYALSSNDIKTIYSSLSSSGENLLGKWLNLGQKNFWVSTYHSDTTGIFYISLISSDTILSTLKTTMIWFSIIFIVTFLAIFVISYIVTNDSFTNIRKIIDTFSDAEKGIYPRKAEQKINDEYDIILMNIITLFLNSTVLKSNLDKQKYERQAAELTALQLQINPHFLSNTLQTLDFESRKQSGGKTTPVNRIITDLSDILRYSLRPSSTLVPLREELNALKKYINIQQYRFGDNLVFYTEIDDSALEYHVPRLILQPIVENSITHGILPSNRTGFIKLKAFARNNRLNISIIDTGAGISRKDLDDLRKVINNIESNNIGLTNVNRRLILTYGKDSALHIISKENYGTCISFSTFNTLSSNTLNEVLLSAEEQNDQRNI